MEQIIQEKISADHLLYVSLKYTKTTDVILNLIERWKSLLGLVINKLLEKAKDSNLIKSIPTIPKFKVEKIKEVYRKDQTVMEAISLYEFFKDMEKMEKIRENEFRKNVTLKVLNKGEWISINIEKLKEYNLVIENIIATLNKIS